MENKKTKLTISGNPKKTVQNFSQSRPLGKKTVVIDKQPGKNLYKGSYKKNDSFKKSSNFKKNTLSQSKLFTKPPQFTSDFEKRKLAEQRATKKLKADSENKDKKSNAIEFLSDLGNPYYEVLIDLDGTKSIELGAFGVPETYLINNKIVVKKYIGPLNDIKFKEIIDIIKNEKN